jgi:hypothetical protein
MFEFGSGSLFGFPVSGNTAANPTPIKFGTLQDVSLDISGDIKELYGQKQFPEAVARGKIKLTGKAKFARINGKMLNDLFFGQTMGTGMKATAVDELHTVATSVTITPPSSGVFVNDSRGDQGVIYQATGIPLVKVASAPAVGQYSVATSTGIYTFNATDVGTAVLISYMYTLSAAGTQLNITNQFMGFAPTFQALLTTNYNLQQMNVLLYQAVASKLSIATKQEDFIIPEFDFSCFANAGGQVIDIYSNE